MDVPHVTDDGDGPRLLAEMHSACEPESDFDDLYTDLTSCGRAIWQMQGVCDRAFRSFGAGRLTPDEFRTLGDQLFHVMPEGDVKRRLRTRMNRNLNGTDRTLGDFALEIYQGHRGECEAVGAWRRAMLHTGRFTQLDLADNGTDNSGRLVLDWKMVSQKADFKLTARGGSLIPDGTHLLEVKVNNRGAHKATYKLHNLREYHAQGCYVLTVWHDFGAMSWGLFGPPEIDRMLADLPLAAYREIGGNVGVQLRREQFERYLNYEKMVVPD